MNSPNKYAQIEPIKPNYHEDDAIALLERWYDEWSKDEDWWHGSKTWDLNIFTDSGEEEFEYGSRWVVAVYGLEQHPTKEFPSINTSNEIDLFELKL